MSSLLNDPTHWHLRAQEARLMAYYLEDGPAREGALKIADEHERLAVRAAKRIAHDAASEDRSVATESDMSHAGVRRA